MDIYLVAVNFLKQVMFLVQSLTIMLAAAYIAMSRDDKSTTFRGTGMQQHEAFVESWIIPQSSINNEEMLYNNSVGPAFSDNNTDIKTDYRFQQKKNDELYLARNNKPTTHSNGIGSPNLSC